MASRDQITGICREMFDRIDVNNNGYIEKYELKPIWPEMVRELQINNKLDQNDFDAGFDMLDQDHDEQISFQEMHEWFEHWAEQAGLIEFR